MIDPILDALDNIDSVPDVKTKKKTEPKKETIPPGRRIVTVPAVGGDEPPASLQEKKTAEEVRKLQIANETAERILVERKLVQSILGELSQSVQTNFVDTSKRYAPEWAARLEIPEKERFIEKLIGDMIEIGINGFISDVERLTSDEIFLDE